MSWLERAASPIPERLAPVLEAMPEAARSKAEADLRLLDERGLYGKDDLHRALYDQTETSLVREVAAWVLGRVGDRRDSTTLARSVGDLEPSAIRRAAVQALGLLPSPAAIDALISRLDEDPEQEVRSAAAAGLGTLASRKGVDALCRRLADPSEDDEVRGFCAEALGHVLAYEPRSVEAVQVLRAALTDPSSSVRFWAAFALGEAGDISDVGRLQQLEADAVEVFGGATVADEARQSIEQIRARANASPQPQRHQSYLGLATLRQRGETSEVSCTLYTRGAAGEAEWFGRYWDPSPDSGFVVGAAELRFHDASEAEVELTHVGPASGRFRVVEGPRELRIR
jgi:hypothetical protein